MTCRGLKPLRGRPLAEVLSPTPYTLHPAPYTLHPTPCTPHPTPHTLHPKPSTLNSPGGGRNIFEAKHLDLKQQYSEQLERSLSPPSRATKYVPDIFGPISDILGSQPSTLNPKPIPDIFGPVSDILGVFQGREKRGVAVGIGNGGSRARPVWFVPLSRPSQDR